MRRLRIFWALALLSVVPVSTLSGARAEPPVLRPAAIVELFTSQGCSSCPPADRFAAELAGRADLVVLSHHVDYWNYIGWNDPFSSPAATARQRAYGRTLKLRYIYTPQIVVDGRAHGVGSNRGKIEALIDRAARRPKLAIALRHGADKTTAVIHLPAAAHSGPPADVLMAELDRAHTTKVRRGENAGRTLVNANVVRDLAKIGAWTGEEIEISVPIGHLAAKGRDGCAVLVQDGEGGPILGAALLPVR